MKVDIHTGPGGTIHQEQAHKQSMVMKAQAILIFLFDLGLLDLHGL